MTGSLAPVSGGTTPPDTATPAPPGRPAMTWRAPDGTVWPLTDPALGWRVLRPVVGLGAAPDDVTTSDRPRGGVSVDAVDLAERDILLPIRIGGRTDAEYLGRYRQLAGAFTQSRRLGAGWLTVTRPDGSARKIAAWYRSGFDAAGNRRLAETVPVSLLCVDPMWTDDADPLPTVFEFQATTAPFLNPYPQVAPATSLNAAALANPGDDVAYPVWVITGPAASITATLDVTGQSWTFTPPVSHGPLLAGQSVTIATEPMSVRYQDGSNWSSGLAFPADLWPVPPCSTPTTVTLTVAGAAAGTKVSVTVPLRYETS
jgi:hypothetical protein